jgi:hypothetical protein
MRSTILNSMMVMFVIGAGSTVWAQSSVIEADIMSLDQETREGLVQDAIATMNDPESAQTDSEETPQKQIRQSERTPVSASDRTGVIVLESIVLERATSSEKDQLDTADDSQQKIGGTRPLSRSGQASGGKRRLKKMSRKREYLKPVKLISRDYVNIIKQRDNHLLITVGDVVYLTPAKRKRLSKNDRFLIYKYVQRANTSVRAKALDWFEEVGELRILECDDQLSIGLVIAARDIIQQGDVVYLGSRL